jgi:hypothetical protein
MSFVWISKYMKRAKLPNPGHCAYSLRRIAFAFRGHLRPHTKAECAVCVCIDVSLGWKPASFVGSRRLRRCSTAECERALHRGAAFVARRVRRTLFIMHTSPAALP